MKNVAKRVVTCSGSSPPEKSWADGSYNPSVPGIATEADSKNSYGKVRKERIDVKGKDSVLNRFRQLGRNQPRGVDRATSLSLCGARGNFWLSE
jgi:hypothetical protein